MRYIAQIITNNILQEIPTIALTYRSGTFSKKYMFNIPEQHSRFSRRHWHYEGYGMSLFFTKYNTDTMAGLTRFLLELNINIARKVDNQQQKKKNFVDFQRCYNTMIYLNNSAYIFWAAMKKQFGFRLLPYSFYNYHTGQELFGLRTAQQNRLLYENSTYEWIRGQYSEDKIREIVGQPPSKASSYMVEDTRQENKSAWIYNDSTIEVRTFSIGAPSSTQVQTYYNHLIIPLQQHLQTNQQKLNKLRKQNPQITNQTLKNLYTSGTLTLSSGITINLSSIKQPYQQNTNLLILHYKTSQHLQQIINNAHLNSYIRDFSKKNQHIKQIIHIVEGNGQILFSEQFSRLRLKFGDVEHIICNRYCRDYGGSNGIKQFHDHMLLMYPHFYICLQVKRYGFWANIIDQVTELYLKFANKEIMKRFVQRQVNKDQKLEGRISWERTNYQLVFAPTYAHKYTQIKLQPGENKMQTRSISHVNPSPTLNEHQNTLKYKLQKITKQSDPTIIFLGTSSMRSVNQRNVSGIVLKFKNVEDVEDFSILLDCGDGILDQFNNHFGVNYDKQLLKLKIVFVSHMHQDHCAGLFHFLAKRNGIIREQIQKKDWGSYRMFVVIPENMVEWYEVFNKNMERLDQFNDVVIVQSIIQPDVESMIKKLAEDKVGVFQGVKLSQPKDEKSNKTNGSLKKNGIFSKSKEVKQNEDNSNSTIDSLNKVELTSELRNPKQDKKQQKLEQFIQKNRLLDSCYESEYFPSQMSQKSDSELRIILNQFKEAHSQNLLNFKKLLHDKKLTKFSPIPVYHCSQSYGIHIEHRSAVGIAFSGDCRPTSVFLRTIRNARTTALLIHEATFKSGQWERARRSRHSTTAQAIEVGFKSSSLVTMLTHFANQNSNTKLQTSEQISQVIQKVDKEYIKYRVGRASDHMEFKLSQMYKLPLLRSLI